MRRLAAVGETCECRGIGRYRRIHPEALEVRLPDAELRRLDEEDIDRVVGDLGLDITQPVIASGIGACRFVAADQRIEIRIGITEVVVVASVDGEIHRLDVLDDRQVEFPPAEHLVEPLRPLDVFDVEPNADLRELRGDDFARATRVRPGRQAKRGVEAVGIARFGEERPRTIGIMRVTITQLDPAAILAAEVTADRLAEAEERAVDNRVAINRVGDCPAYPQIVERRPAVIHRHDHLARRRADHHLQVGIAGELRDVFRCRVVGIGIDVAGTDRGIGRRGIANDPEDDAVGRS